MGTAFTVLRDALGTRVEVLHGRVEVACSTLEPAVLQAGGQRLCLPDTPLGLLRRAITLRDRGASPQDILATVDLGLAGLSPDGWEWSEYQVIRMWALDRSGRREEARRLAESYLADGHWRRRDEVARRLARVGLEQGGCAAATPWLESLRAQGTAAPDDLTLLAACAGRAH